jgi:hypothetical protein
VLDQRAEGVGYGGFAGLYLVAPSTFLNKQVVLKAICTWRGAHQASWQLGKARRLDSRLEQLGIPWRQVTGIDADRKLHASKAPAALELNPHS